jgi:hypothetical protein
MRRPAVKSRRQHIRLWFEFYKLALDDPDLQANLEVSRSIYEPWGNCRGVKFDAWWRTHSDLFSTRVEVATSVRQDPQILTVAIPLNQPASMIRKEVLGLVEEAQTKWWTAQGVDPSTLKSLATSTGSYPFTSKEIRGDALNETLIIYSQWRSEGRPRVNSAFCLRVIERMRSRPRSNWIPLLLQQTAVPDHAGNLTFDENVLRSVRRKVEDGKKICRAVSLGKFPK